ncbi:MAG: hypothetical protein ABSG82_06120 [Sedimentisphaerales bacterium]
MFMKHILIISSALLILSFMGQSNSALGACGNNDWWTPRTVPTVFYNYQDDWQGNYDGNWCNPQNWATQRSATAAPPDPNTCAEIAPNADGPNITGKNCVVGPWGNCSAPSGNCSATCSRLDIQPWSWAGAASIDCNVAPTAGFVDCGVVITICGRSDFDSSSQGYGTLNVYGGTMYTPGVWSTTTPPAGQENQIGLYVGGGASRAAACYGIVNMYNGLISVPRVAVYNGIVNIYGGIIEDTHDTDADFIITNNYARNVINIAGGTLLLRGDRTSEVANYIANGLIVPCNNRGLSSLSYDYNVTNPCYTTFKAFCDWGAA